MQDHNPYMVTAASQQSPVAAGYDPDRARELAVRVHSLWLPSMTGTVVSGGLFGLIGGGVGVAIGLLLSTMTVAVFGMCATIVTSSVYPRGLTLREAGIFGWVIGSVTGLFCCGMVSGLAGLLFHGSAQGLAALVLTGLAFGAGGLGGMLGARFRLSKLVTMLSLRRPGIWNRVVWYRD